MRKTGFWIGIALTIAALSGCSPLVVGAGAAVVVDEVRERETGGDGFF
ncbi:MAG: hypothetical protein AAGA12_12825 [Pseudomonadota bacterium]